jgi:large subunit ribosomal protein L3
MLNVILGSKVKQSQEFTEAGKRIPVTWVAVGLCFVTEIVKRPTFNTIQLGYGTIKSQTKAENGHLKKAGLTTKLRFLRSFQVDEVTSDIKLGQEVKAAEIFKAGDNIRVTGTGSGKGFASAIKRYHFKGGPRTHGQSDRERAPGSIGQTTTPGRVYKGKRMAGRMGGDRVTVNGLSVVGFDAENKIMKIKGLIPGRSHSLVIITKEI